MLTWHQQGFTELSLFTLYDLLKVRTDIFVVEQNCPYPELDNIDKHDNTKHLFALLEGNPIAYARIIAPNISYQNHSSIGRVLVIENHRKDKLGHQLVKRAIQSCITQWPDIPIKIGAQSHLQGFYQKHGFTTTSEPYIEDGIEHVTMVYSANNSDI
ncbi:GNAT family N-acetyltransferase [Marinomonas sp. C2222]|uniref:GNAT family N-acetyltransferase n=1 Tax=Marinomonas sargassi TaxID=2984494 RepID=A0ABT2YTW9_9GAMM|nr:GNAT family N-acetyltransferase [Marinomonas sargassi]MCV2403343.1 GNAT family N-acetyltransferase [Marinomonas sargassi]